MSSARNSDGDIHLNPEYWQVPLSCLSPHLIFKLHIGLNNEQPLGQNDVLGDWRGFAEKIGFIYARIQNFSLGPKPTVEVLEEWRRSTFLQPTAGRLVDILTQLGRQGILANIKSFLEHDIRQYIRQRDGADEVQDSMVSQSSSTHLDLQVDEFRMMTIQDVSNGYPTFYDAFVSYANTDLAFVKDMLAILEGPEYNLKFLVPNRDDLPGGSTYTVFAKCIQDRCRKTVIILSPDYLASGSCCFQTRFAQSISPGARCKKLVPILRAPCTVPNILRNTIICDHTDSNMRDWFWQRVAHAITAPLNLCNLWDDPNDSASDIYQSLSTSGSMPNLHPQQTSSQNSQPIIFQSSHATDSNSPPISSLQSLSLTPPTSSNLPTPRSSSMSSSGLQSPSSPQPSQSWSSSSSMSELPSSPIETRSTGALNRLNIFRS